MAHEFANKPPSAKRHTKNNQSNSIPLENHTFQALTNGTVKKSFNQKNTISVSIYIYLDLFLLVGVDTISRIWDIYKYIYNTSSAHFFGLWEQKNTLRVKKYFEVKKYQMMSEVLFQHHLVFFLLSKYFFTLSIFTLRGQKKWAEEVQIS